MGCLKNNGHLHIIRKRRDIRMKGHENAFY